MYALAITALAIIVAGGIFWWVLDDRLLSRLRVSHPDVWKALGPPSKAFDDGGLAYTHAVEEFCRRSDLHSKCGADVVRLANFVRLYHRVYAVVAVLGLAALGVIAWRTL